MKVERIYKVFDEYRGLSDSKLRPTELKSEQFLKAFRELLDKKNNWPFLLPLRLALEACTHCGTCAEACPLYIGSGRNKLYSPVYRTDMLRKIYKRYFTLTGKIFRSLIGAKEITEQDANAMAEAAYRCTICRRCVLACPFGLDNGLVMREIRKIFAELRIIPEELKEEGVDNQLRYGSAPKISYEALMNILDFVKGEIEENRKNVNIKIPVDKVGAKYLIINNAGDYLSFLDTIRGIIEVMNYVNVDWTFNSPRTGVFDNVNYGLFYSDKDMLQVIRAHLETINKLKPEYVVIGECGHAYDVLGHLMKDLIPPEERPFKVIHIVELYEKFLREGKLKLDKHKNSEPVTFHDSCKIGRCGGIYDEPRRVIAASCRDFREMYPNREYNYCCGGGGGFALMSKYNFLDFRMKTYGRLKMQQVKDTAASVLITICANCKRQFLDMVSYYNLNINVSGLSEVLANALVY